MTHIPHGDHLIAGEKIRTEARFSSAPAAGQSHEFSAGNPALVTQARAAAHAAFEGFSATTREERAALLEAIADAETGTEAFL